MKVLLLGGAGVAFLYAPRGLPRRTPPPTTRGVAAPRRLSFGPRPPAWPPDARRFEQGTPALAAIAAQLGGLEFLAEVGWPRIFPAVREHWADVGGAVPGSLSGTATEIYQEGLRLPPVKIAAGGKIARDVMEIFLANTRVHEEREGDLRAQLAALSVGSDRFLKLTDAAGRAPIAAATATASEISAAV